MKDDCALKKLALSKWENWFSSASLISFFVCVHSTSLDQGITILYSSADINCVPSVSYVFLLIMLIPLPTQ